VTLAAVILEVVVPQRRVDPVDQNRAVVSDRVVELDKEHESGVMASTISATAATKW
jgi:hypothetical protein